MAGSETNHTGLVPGKVEAGPGEIQLNVGRETLFVAVRNMGDRPIQIGSHYHFYEANPYLSFDREATVGFRLNIPAGTATRFEPGQSRSVELVRYAGKQEVYGFQGKVMGKVSSLAQASKE